MPYRNMTIKELAQMMGADARRLERMAERGEIPCQKIGGQLRFNRAEITGWLQQNMPVMAGNHLAEGRRRNRGAHRQHQRDQALISPMLRPEGGGDTTEIPRQAQPVAGIGVPGLCDRIGV